jgi:DNA-binding transcriptional LysR family regulator
MLNNIFYVCVQRQVRVLLQPVQDSEMISLVAMSYVIAVADKKSFTAAASSLGVKQSTVSRRIRALEEDLGVALFERETTGVSITNAGKIFLQQTAAVLDQLNQAFRSAANAGSGVEGEIRLGIEAPLSDRFLIGLLHDFRRLHKNVSIIIVEGSKTDQLHRLSRKEIDFAFVHGKPIGSEFDINFHDFDSQPFWETKLFVAIPYDHMLASRRIIDLESLKPERILIGAYGCEATLNDYELALEDGMRHRPLIDRQFVSREALFHLVGLGLGVTFTSQAAAAKSYDNVVIRPIQGVVERLQYCGAWRAQNDNPAFRRFLSLARSKAVLKKCA